MSAFALGTINQYSELLWAWTLRTVRARYQQSLLGGVWAILQPAATVAVFTVIFTMFIPIDTGGIPYVIFAYSAMVPWTLFATSMMDMVDSLVVNMNLVSKIYFPRTILPIAAMLARLLDFIIAGAILILLMIYYKMPFDLQTGLLLPYILLIQLLLTLGIGFAGAALNLFYRDIKHLITLGIQLWLYATPIVYPISVVPDHIRPFYALNPMVGIIEAYRSILLKNQFPDSYLVISSVVAALLFIGGYWFFKRVEYQFADLV